MQVPREQYSRLEGEDRGYKEAHFWGAGEGVGMETGLVIYADAYAETYIKNPLETVGKKKSVKITQTTEKKRNRIMVIIL